ncbi:MULTISPECIES: hypothetical protein [Paraburkholderia]|nr:MULTISPECIES: hypothetical protein [Paraburkholderia]MCX4163535.1 hypothetical protein [Paraburkholderia megapolitana]MDN7159030.1 hypothetical protein [Paraburkholderia sp. CHISQ3]MDQ6496077.1 hypothetical protein [Paraburkholderia megapolitana]
MIDRHERHAQEAGFANGGQRIGFGRRSVRRGDALSPPTIAIANGAPQ